MTCPPPFLNTYIDPRPPYNPYVYLVGGGEMTTICCPTIPVPTGTVTSAASGVGPTVPPLTPPLQPHRSLNIEEWRLSGALSDAYVPQVQRENVVTQGRSSLLRDLHQRNPQPSPPEL